MSVPASDVEQRRKKGFPVWLALLALLALIAVVILLLFVFDVFGEDEQAAVGPAGTEQNAAQQGDSAAAGDGGPVTDLNALLGGGDASSLVGREVDLSDVQVQSVVGDKTFWVGPSEDQQVFVFLEEETDPQGVEGGVDVEAGQTVAITGTVENVPESPQQAFELDQDNATQLADQQVYIRAEQVQPQS